MIDERIIGYIKQELSNGTPLKKIEKKLLQAGHKKKVVKEHLETFKGKPEFNKIYIFEALIIIGIILLFYFLFTNSSEKTYEPQYLTHEEDLKGGVELLDKALKEGTSDNCEGIGNKELRDQCFEQFESKSCDEKCENLKSFNAALINKNPSFCAEISDKALKEQCYEVLEVQGDE